MKNYISLLLFMGVLFSSFDNDQRSNAEAAEFKDLTGLDGCGMVIQLTDDSYLEVLNQDDLEIEIIDGKKIWIKYHTVSDAASICMVGDIVEIDCISER